MISQTAEYALRAIVHLASVHLENVQLNGVEPSGAGVDGAEFVVSSRTTQQIAAATQVPPLYLSKVLQNLNRAGLIRSQRGLGGGFSLAKSPHEMTVYEVVQVVDPLQRILACPLGLEAHSAGLCPLHAKLDQATALVEKAFRETTIATLSAAPNFGELPAG